MLEGIACLEEMVLALGIGDGILSNVIHRKVNVFYLLSKGKHIVVGSIKVRNRVLGIKVREKSDCIMKVGGWFKVHKKFI